MVKSKTSVWNYFEEPNSSGKTTSRVMCKFCNEQYAKNSTLMKSHLLNCIKAPEIIKSKFVTCETVKETIKNTTNLSSDQPGFLIAPSTPDHDTPNTSSFPTFFEIYKKEEQTELTVCNTDQSELTSLFAKAVFTSDVPFSIVDNQNWKLFFEAMQPSFKLPNKHSLSNCLLDEEFAKVQTDIDDKLSNASNVSLKWDGWSNKNIINIVVTTPQPFLVKSFFTNETSQSTEYFKKILTEVIEKYDPKKFMVIITDNTKIMRKAALETESIYPQIIFYGCMAHTLIQLGSDMLKVDSVAAVVLNIKKIVTIITSNEILNAKFTAIKKELNLETSLNLPSQSRWRSLGKCLEDILKCKFALQRLCISENVMVQQKIQTVRNSILIEDENNKFWTSVHQLKNFINLVIKWISIFKNDGLHIHLVCQAFKEIEENFSADIEYTILNETERNRIREIFEKRKSYALKPIHMAADLLNPYSCGSYLIPTQKMEALRFINNLSNQMELSSNHELGDYLAKSSFFSESFIWEILDKKVDILNWWTGFCGDTSISKIANRILNMSTTSVVSEESLIMDTVRSNNLTEEQEAKLNFIKLNNKLISISTKKKSVSESDDDISYGGMNNKKIKTEESAVEIIDSETEESDNVSGGYDMKSQF